MALLAVIVGFNLANLSEFFRSIPGPEDAMAGHPLTLVSVILLQIVVTMWAVWWAARKVSHPERRSGLAFMKRDGAEVRRRTS
jgi:hypothetical protein